jgi:lipopolysaccharide transport system ATP-binding protein
MSSNQGHHLVRKQTPDPPAPADDVGTSPIESRKREDDIVIRVSNVSKCYLLYERPQDRLKQSIVPKLQRLIGRPPRIYYREYWALRDVSFEVRKGEIVGIIGRNGAGKSTLLQILCGTLYPNAGTVEINGRVAALLELGSGFNPEFSGRENVYLYASVLGLSREEVDARFEDIAAFADIGVFIDQPLKTYSSGMHVRLAFAVAACVDPDILIVDEALAVGDIRFQARCFRHLEQLVERGTSVLFVSHSVEQITRHCDRAILLEKGAIDTVGSPKTVTNRYLDLMFGVDRRSDNTVEAGGEARTLSTDDAQPRITPSVFEQRPGYNSLEYRWGNRQAEIVDFVVTTDGATHTIQLRTGTRVSVIIWARFHRDVEFPIFGLTIKTPDGVTVFGSNSRDCTNGPIVRPAKAEEIFCVTYSLDQVLGEGHYLISVGIAEEKTGEVIPLDRRFDSIQIVVMNSKSRSFGLVDFNMKVDIE